MVAAMPFVENVPSCRELIVACCDVPPLHTYVCLPKEHAVLFRIIVDRGGLSSPLPPCVAATARAVQLYMAVASEQNVKINFSPSITSVLILQSLYLRSLHVSFVKVC